MRISRGLLLAALVGLTFAAAAEAAPNLSPALRASLTRLRQGDAQGGYDDLRALAAKEPENLGAEFGVLLALDALGFDDEPARAQEFEKRVDAFIAHASTRRDRRAADLEALFYLAQAYGARAAYRFENSKGMWGPRATRPRRSASPTTTSRRLRPTSTGTTRSASTTTTSRSRRASSRS